LHVNVEGEARSENGKNQAEKYSYNENLASCVKASANRLITYQMER
jgi:hypothetical protein